MGVVQRTVVIESDFPSYPFGWHAKIRLASATAGRRTPQYTLVAEGKFFLLSSFALGHKFVILRKSENCVYQLRCFYSESVWEFSLLPFSTSRGSVHSLFGFSVEVFCVFEVPTQGTSRAYLPVNTVEDGHHRHSCWKHQHFSRHLELHVQSTCVLTTYGKSASRVPATALTAFAF